MHQSKSLGIIHKAKTETFSDYDRSQPEAKAKPIVAFLT